MAERSYRARRAAGRAERIRRARHNLAHVQAEAQLLVARPCSAADRAGRSFGTALVVVMGSQLVLGYAGLCNAATPSQHVDLPRKIQVVMAPVTGPVPKLPALEAPRQPITPPPALAAKRRPPAKREPKAPASDPTPKSEPAPATLPIVGLTFESTSSSANGPVFAIGETLSGTTARVAAEATASERTPPPPTEPVPPRTSRNQRAAPRAQAGVKVEPARRLSRVEPVYPPLLGRQNLEADVTVRVSIGRDGTLLSAQIVRSAEQAEFNQAALAAAKQERFAPETHDGAPVETSLTYTYRFRMTP